MDVKIEPSGLSGFVRVPSSKSEGHRALICAALSNGVSEIFNFDTSGDLERTVCGLRAFGAKISVFDSCVKVDGSTTFSSCEDAAVDCFESASSLRFLIPLSLLRRGKTFFSGTDRLSMRSLQPYIDIFTRNEIEFHIGTGRNPMAYLPLEISGIAEIPNVDISLEGGVSSQFVTGLLFVLPFLPGGTRVSVTTPLESKPYVDITLRVLQRFGVCVCNKSYSEFYISSPQTYIPASFVCEADYSQAAFFIAAGVIGRGKVTCGEFNLSSLQGDRKIVEILRKMGARIECEGGRITAFPSKTFGIDIDASDIPDIVPILAVVAAFSDGVTTICNVGRLRIKESDRMEAISSQLCRLGASIYAIGDTLVINGTKGNIRGGKASSFGDHRIAMSIAVAATRCDSTVTLDSSECVGKSYPRFWEDFRSIGGRISY